MGSDVKTESTAGSVRYTRPGVDPSSFPSDPASSVLTEDELTEIRLFDIAFGDASELGLP